MMYDDRQSKNRELYRQRRREHFAKADDTLTPLDADLEAAIDSVGRDRVFDYAKHIGWSSYDSIPKFVWWGIVNQLRQPGGTTAA